MTSICSFLEAMDHEFRSLSEIEVGRPAYKVDTDRGIKNELDLNILKSVDYFESHIEKGLLFVEFSDLISQDAQIKSGILSIKESSLDSETKRQLIKKHYSKIIHKELVQKYKDSHMILDETKKRLTEVPSVFNDLAKYIIVVCQKSDKLTTDEARILDDIKNKVKLGLPCQIVKQVSMITLDTFIS